MYTSEKNILKNVRAISCGSYHVLAAVGNEVYSTGLNNYGQLGHGHTNNLDYFQSISLLKNIGIIDVQCGLHHTIVLTTKGKLLGFGRGDSGQVGVPDIASVAGGFIDVPLIPGKFLF